MTKKVIFIIAVVLISLSITTGVMAALPGSGWWTAYMVQNVGDDLGTLSFTAYDSKSDSEIGSQIYNFNPGTALIYDPGKPPNIGNYIGFSSQLPGGFEGSVVLSGSVPMSAAAQLSNYSNGNVGTTAGAASGMYQAFSSLQADTMLRFPIVKNNWANAATTFFIQAAGQDAEVTVTYNMGDGTTHNITQQITANKMYMFDPSAAGVASTNCGNDFNNSPCFGAAVATSTTPIAGVVVEHPFMGSPVGAILSSRALTSDDEDTLLFAPNIKNDYYYAEATAAIMNVGTEPAKVRATITVTYGPNAGQVYVQDLVIQPNRTQSFSKWLNTLGGMPKGNFGAARIESLNEDGFTAQPLVGSTNHSKFQGAIPMGRARDNYNCYSISSATNRISTPVVKEFFGPFTGGLTVVNVGDQPAIINFEYYEYGSSNVYEFWTTSPVIPGAAIDTGRVSYNESNRFQNNGEWNFEELRGKQFSVITYSQNDEEIISLTTMYHSLSSFDKFYDMMSYAGFSTP